MKNPGISVIIPFRNSRQTIVRTLDSLADQLGDMPVEIIPVDDRSTDDTVALCQAHRVAERWSVRVVPNQRGGLSHAYNLGIAAARYDVVLLCHSDCYVLEDDAFTRMMVAFEDPGVVIAHSWVVLPSEDWQKMSFWDRVANARYVGSRTRCCGGKFTAYRKSAMDAIGAFDDNVFFSAGEDVDIGIRLKPLGSFHDLGITVVHGHLYPEKSHVRFLLKKQFQLGQGLGALLRKFKRYPGSLQTAASHGLKLALFAGLCVKPTSAAALLALCVLAILYARKAFVPFRLRSLLIVPVNIAQFAVFLFAALVGLITGKQQFYYK